MAVSRPCAATDTCRGMLSKKAKYAIKALIRLADHQGEPVRIADLARTEQIPPKFLELILLGLRNNGVLQSRKGKGGGYLLARDPAKIYLGQIIRMFDGPWRRPMRQPDSLRALRRLPQRGGMRRTSGHEGSAGSHRQGARWDQSRLAPPQGRPRSPTRPQPLAHRSANWHALCPFNSI